MSESDEEYQKLAEPYLKDMGFAFFAVNFGYSISDYEQLTPRQRTFIYKAYENKMIADTANIYNAVFTAYYNANRPKNRRPLKLFKKKSKKADQGDIEENLNIIREIEQEKGKSWVDLIYKRKGLRKEEKNV